MPPTHSSKPFRFLDLPIELRVRIYEIVFFEDVDGRVSIQPARAIELPLDESSRLRVLNEPEMVVHTAPRQIHPYRRPRDFKSKFDWRPWLKRFYKSLKRFSLGIFRVCRRIQVEAEPIFYGSASFNLMGGQFHKPIGTWEWLSQLPRRYRRLIRRVEHFCFDSTSWWSAYRPLSEPGDSFFDWSLLMTILAQECPALQSLKLWVHSDQREYNWLAGISEEDPWIKALLQLERLQDLQEFDMPGIRPIPWEESEHRLVPERQDVIGAHRMISPWLRYGQVPRPMQSSPAENASIVSFLKARLECSMYRSVSIREPQSSSEAMLSFPIFKLPQAVRARIYRYILLPSNKRLHPYIGSWYDETTRNAVPLLLTSRHIREEAEDVLYGEAVFTVPEVPNTIKIRALHHFFEELDPRLRAKIRHVRIDRFGCYSGMDLLRYLVAEMCISSLSCSLSHNDGQILDRMIRNPSVKKLYWRMRLVGLADFENIFKHFQRVEMRTDIPEEAQYLPQIHEWLASLVLKGTAVEQRRRTLRPRNPAIKYGAHDGRKR